MKRTLALALLACASAAVYAQTVTITSSLLMDGGVAANGTIYWSPVTQNGQAISYRRSGGGISTVTPQTATVTAGAFSMAFPDTSLTNPANPCISVRLSTSNGGNVLGPGYTCVQPAANNAWCTAGVCNFDNLVPNLTANPVYMIGQQGPIGATGATGAPGNATITAGSVGQPCVITSSTTCAGAAQVNGLEAVPAAAGTRIDIAPGTSWEALNAKLVTLIPTAQQPTVTYNGWPFPNETNMKLPTAGCTGGNAQTNNSCFFRYPFGAFTQGSGFPAQYMWTLNNLMHCFPTNTITAANPSYYVDFVDQGQFFDIPTRLNQSPWNIQVNGQWLYPGQGPLLANTGALVSIHVDFGSPAYRTIRLFLGGGFFFAGIIPGGSSDLVQATSTTFPTNPLFAVASDSTGQGVYEYQTNGEPWPYTLAKMRNAPVLDYSCGGTGYVANAGGTFGTLAFGGASGDWNQLVTDITATGQSAGEILIGHGINDDTSTLSAVQTNAAAAFAGLTSALPHWQLAVVGPWNPSTPPPGGNVSVAQAGIYAAAAANSPVVPVTFDMIDTAPITGQWSAGLCTSPALKPLANGANVCTFINNTSPHPTGAGADMVAALIYASDNNSLWGFPNFASNYVAPVLPPVDSSTLPYILPGTVRYPTIGYLQGTISWPNSSATVTGVGTFFTKQVCPGCTYFTVSNESFTVLSITSDTSLTTTAINSGGSAGPGAAWELGTTMLPVFAVGFNGRLPYTNLFDLANVSPEECGTTGYVLGYTAANNPPWGCVPPVSGASLTTANIWTVNGASGTPAEIFNGTWYVGTTPFMKIEPSGTTALTYPSQGVGLAINAPSGCNSGNCYLQMWGLNGATLGFITGQGLASFAGVNSIGSISFGQAGNVLRFYSGSAYDVGLSRVAAGVLGLGNATAGNTSGLLLAGNACKPVSALTLTASPQSVCSWSLPSSAQTWTWQCKGIYTLTAGTSPTLILGMNASQAPTSETGSASIFSTLTGASTQATVTSTSSGNVTVLTGATNTQANAQFEAFGTIQAGSTSGTFAITAEFGGTGSPAGTVNVGTTCTLF